MITALVARSVEGFGFVMAHDSVILKKDIELTTDAVCDLGIAEPPGPGLWIWNGELLPDVDGVRRYQGQYEPVTTFDQIDTLLKMHCGKI